VCSLVSGLPGAPFGTLLARLADTGLVPEAPLDGHARLLPAGPAPDAAGLRAAGGRLVAVASDRLGDLPKVHAYRLLFLDADVDDCLRALLGPGADAAMARRLGRVLAAHRNGVLGYLRGLPNLQLLVLPAVPAAGPAGATALGGIRAFFAPMGPHERPGRH
jgi:hypothetical protein